MQRQVPRILMVNKPSINQVTKHAEIPQNLNVDTVVDMPVVMQRQVPRIRTVLKTVEDHNRPSINQVTKHAEIPQIYYIENVVVDMPVVMQRQVPQIQTVLKTVVPPAQFGGRVVEALAIMQMRHCRSSRRRTRSKCASRSLHRLPLRQCRRFWKSPALLWKKRGDRLLKLIEHTIGQGFGGASHHGT